MKRRPNRLCVFWGSDLQNFAKVCADMGTLRVVFVSSEGIVLPLVIDVDDDRAGAHGAHHLARHHDGHPGHEHG